MSLQSLLSQFPLVEYPFENLGERLGKDGGDVLKEVRALLESFPGAVISGEFFPALLGYALSVYSLEGKADAGQFQDHRVLEAVYFSEWQTTYLIVLDRNGNRTFEKDCEVSLRKMTLVRAWWRGTEISLDKYLDKYYIEAKSAGEINQRQVRTVRFLQTPIPLIDTPYDSAAGESGLGTDEFLSEARSLEGGLLSSYGLRLTPVSWLSFRGFTSKTEEDFDTLIKTAGDGGDGEHLDKYKEIRVMNFDQVTLIGGFEKSVFQSLGTRPQKGEDIVINQPEYFQDPNDRFGTKFV